MEVASGRLSSHPCTIAGLTTTGDDKVRGVFSAEGSRWVIEPTCSGYHVKLQDTNLYLTETAHVDGSVADGNGYRVKVRDVNHPQEWMFTEV